MEATVIYKTVTLDLDCNSFTIVLNIPQSIVDYALEDNRYSIITRGANRYAFRITYSLDGKSSSFAQQISMKLNSMKKYIRELKVKVLQDEIRSLELRLGEV
ncbi:MAG: hypothetical protein ACFFE4_19610 [Candidatus Thorarchaeota archaeon]